MPTALKKDTEPENGYYTYADYLAWDTDERYEIIDGKAFMMAAPSIPHQTISGELFGQFWSFLKGKPCRVFAAPLDVRLFPREDNSDETIVQPDILVVCDESKLADNRSCRGAPDLVIEILSPSNITNLMFLKFQKYLRAGVREYWVIDPSIKGLQIHILEKGAGETPEHFISTAYDTVAAADVRILPGLRIDFAAIWNAMPDNESGQKEGKS
jgi:Uma2 family endonuclease